MNVVKSEKFTTIYKNFDLLRFIKSFFIVLIDIKININQNHGYHLKD